MALSSVKNVIPAKAGIQFFTFFISFVSFTSAAWSPDIYSIETRDRVKLVSDFSAPQEGKPTLVLLHGLGSGRYEWMDLADRMTSQGWGVVAVDARGHGDSSGDYKRFGRPMRFSPWEKMIDDVGAFLRALEKDKGIRRADIILGGASLGANVALNYAGLTRKLKGLVLLSPGWVYQGIYAEQAIKQAKSTPILIISSVKDEYATKSSLKMKQLNPAVTLWTDVRPGHGVQMFDDVLLSRISKWLNAQN